MFLKYRTFPYKFQPKHQDVYGWTLVDIVRQYNGLTGDEAVLSALVERCEVINGDSEHIASLANSAQDILIPVLLSECHKHETEKFRFDFEVEVPEPIPEPIPELTQEIEPPKRKARPKPTPKRPRKKRKIEPDIKQYKTYPYIFNRPNETLEAVIRLYNDMNLDATMIKNLVKIFNSENGDALPPKLGQSVKIPVLLPFCFRHENEHKIFTDE